MIGVKYWGIEREREKKKKKREGQENLSFSLIPQMTPVAEVDPDPSQELLGINSVIPIWMLAFT